MHEAAPTMLLIKSNLSYNSNTSNNDPISAILNEYKTLFRVELSKIRCNPFAPKKPQPGNFG